MAKKKIVEEPVLEDQEEEIARGIEKAQASNPEKEELLALYKTLKDLGINSIGDLEVKISRL